MNEPQKEIYTIFIDGRPVDEVELEGIAHLTLASANLIGVGELVKFVPGNDPVFCGYYTYNQEFDEWQHGFKVEQRPVAVDKDNPGPPPVCKKECKWLKKYDDFERQGNTLRCEVSHLVYEKRCGWNLKPEKIGGHPLDYAPCSFNE